MVECGIAGEESSRKSSCCLLKPRAHSSHPQTLPMQLFNLSSIWKPTKNMQKPITLSTPIFHPSIFHEILQQRKSWQIGQICQKEHIFIPSFQRKCWGRVCDVWQPPWIIEGEGGAGAGGEVASTCKHTQTDTHKHAHILGQTHTRIQTGTYTQTHTRTQTGTYTQTQTYTQTRIDTHAHHCAFITCDSTDHHTVKRHYHTDCLCQTYCTT